MRLARIIWIFMLPLPWALAQHAPHPVTRPAQKAKGGAAGKGGAPQAAHRASDKQIETLEKMTPPAREKALEALPSDRRQKIEARLAHLQKLSPEERAQLRERLQKFESLPPEKQKEVRQLAQKLRALPDDRRPAVHRELKILRNMPEAKREARVTSAQFKRKFSEEEQTILRQSSDLLPEQF